MTAVPLQPEKNAGIRHRLLMIALDFPPVASSGSFRLASFARHLPEHGWTTSVVTARNPFREDTEPVTAASLRADCEVIHAFGFDTKEVLSWSGRYPAFLAFPDRAVSWVADGIRRALRICRSCRIDAIFSSSPVVSAHLIAYAVKKVSGLPWVLELRDPWSPASPYGPLLRRLDARMEYRLLQAADRIVVVTDGMVDVLEQRLDAGDRSKIRLVTNGYDEHVMGNVLEAAKRSPSFNVVHTGSCLPAYRDPAPVLRAVRLGLDRGELPGDTSVDLVGAPHDATLLDEIATLRLHSHVKVIPRTNHREALAATARAAVLLVLQTRAHHDRSIPTKVYEYLRTDRAILGVVRDNSDAANALQGFEGVTLASPTDVDAIADALGSLYRAWADGKADGFSRDVTRYSRGRLTADLAMLLDEVITPDGGATP